MMHLPLQTSYTRYVPRRWLQNDRPSLRFPETSSASDKSDSHSDGSSSSESGATSPLPSPNQSTPTPTPTLPPAQTSPSSATSSTATFSQLITDQPLADVNATEDALDDLGLPMETADHLKKLEESEPSSAAEEKKVDILVARDGVYSAEPEASSSTITSDEELKAESRKVVEHLFASVRSQSSDLVEMVFDEYFFSVMTPVGVAIMLNQLHALPSQEQALVRETCAKMAARYLQMNQENLFQPPLTSGQLAALQNLLTMS